MFSTPLASVKAPVPVTLNPVWSTFRDHCFYEALEKFSLARLKVVAHKPLSLGINMEGRSRPLPKKIAVYKAKKPEIVTYLVNMIRRHLIILCDAHEIDIVVLVSSPRESISIRQEARFFKNSNYTFLSERQKANLDRIRNFKLIYKHLYSDDIVSAFCVPMDITHLEPMSGFQPLSTGVTNLDLTVEQHIYNLLEFCTEPDINLFYKNMFTDEQIKELSNSADFKSEFDRLRNDDVLVQTFRVQDRRLHIYLSVVERIRRFASQLSRLKFEPLTYYFQSFAPAGLEQCQCHLGSGASAVDASRFMLMSLLNQRFGDSVMNAFSRPVNVRHRSQKRSETRRRKFLDALAADNAAKENYISNWPTLPPQDVIFDCIRKYQEGVKYVPGDICCVCGVEKHDTLVCVSLDDKSKLDTYNLNVLNCDDFRIRCQVALTEGCPANDMFDEFRDCHPAIKNVMLCHAGVRTVAENQAPVLQICISCKSALIRSKIPKFSLANNLFRGKLPAYFDDLTWVEEMACCLYRNTAYVTRMYGSTDESQPKMFKGNISTHMMNTVSTAEVLPRTPANVLDQLSIIFVSPGKFDAKKVLGPKFTVRKQKIWYFLLWLNQHNKLYKDVKIDRNVIDQYPENDALPGISDRVIHDEFTEPKSTFEQETAGFSEHPADIRPDDEDKQNDTAHFIDHMGAMDMDNVSIQPHAMTASALNRLLNKDLVQANVPDLTLFASKDWISWYGNPDLFPGMFPTLFGYGIGGFEDSFKDDAEADDPVRNQSKRKNRPTALSFESQLGYYLKLGDRSFRYHWSFLFVGLSILQKRKGHLAASLTVGRSHFREVVDQLTGVSPQTLSTLAQKLSKTFLPTDSLPEEEQHAMQLLKRVNTISISVPGSQTSKIQIRRTIRNYYGKFGLPHLYFTFNPSSQHSPQFQVFYGNSNVDLSRHLPNMPSAYQRSIAVAKDPVAGVEFFHFMVKCLFEHLFGWDYKTYSSNSTGGVLGKLEAHIGTVECTERGGLHGHFLIWLLGGLGPAELREKMASSSVFEGKVCEYFDTIIHHHLPETELVPDPNYEPRTEISRPCTVTSQSNEEELNEWDSLFKDQIIKIGESVQRHRHLPVCEKYGNENSCRFKFPHEHQSKSYYDVDTKSLVLRCLDPMVNYFNPIVLFCCRHNHDIKCILSGEAAKAAMCYISDYITKTDVKTHEQLTLLSRAVSMMPKRCEHIEPIDIARQLLHRCLAQYTYRQHLHATQAVRYALGFDDCLQSHVTVNMSSALMCRFVRQEYEHVLMLAQQSGIDESADLGDNVVINRLGVQSPFTVTQVDDYFFRCDSLIDLTFYDFCRFFKRSKKSDNSTDRHLESGRVGDGITEESTLDDRLDEAMDVDECPVIDETGNTDGPRPDEANTEIHIQPHGRTRQRYPLKEGHPQFETHELVKHTDPAIGHGVDRFVPVVTGMSIPRPSHDDRYFIFALSHFKPFGKDNPLLTTAFSLKDTFDNFNFSPDSRRVLSNYDAIYECEDQRDKERLKKREQSSRTALLNATEALTSHMVADDLNAHDGIEDINPQLSKGNRVLSSRLQYLRTSMTECNWLTQRELHPSSTSQDPFPHSALERNAPTIFDYTQSSKWKKEIKLQEAAVATTQANAANPSTQSGPVQYDDSDEESDIDIGDGYENNSLQPKFMCPLCNLPLDVFNQRMHKKDACNCPKTLSPMISKTTTSGESSSDIYGVLSLYLTKYKLNVEQTNAFLVLGKHVIDKYILKVDTRIGDDHSLRLIMTGPGGTGKTHVVKALQELMDSFNLGHSLRRFAPTGSAANQIDGMTIHRGISIQVHKKKNGKRDNALDDDVDVPNDGLVVNLTITKRNKLMREFRHVRMVMFDEFWMTSADLLAQIDATLRVAKNEPDLIFGGLDVIAAGDPYQYPPVGGRALYQVITNSPKKLDNNALLARWGRWMYKMFNAVISLSIQERMSSDPEYAQAVLRLRTRTCTQADADLFNSRVVMSGRRPFGVDLSKDGFDDAMLLVKENAVRVGINESKALSNCTAAGGPVLHWCAADDSFIDAKQVLGADERRDLINRDFSSSSAIPPGLLPLYVGMPIIVRMRNIATSLGVTNGSTGVVRGLCTRTDRFGYECLECVIVELPTSKAKCSNLPENHFPIFPISVSFKMPSFSKDGTTITIRRKQVPIQPAFAITGHSAQGKTLPKVICNLNKGGFAAYVAASRSRTSKDIALVEPVTVNSLNTPTLPHDLVSDMRRLAALENNTLIRYNLKKGALVDIPDPDHEQDIIDKHVNARKLVLIVKNAPTKRQGSTLAIKGPPVKNGLHDVLPVTRHSLRSGVNAHHPRISAGPIWDNLDWSCAYDCAFTILLNIYDQFDATLRTNWSRQSPLTANLATDFDRILLISSPHQQTEVNTARDKFRDHLSALDPVRFLRHGPVLAVAAHVIRQIASSDCHDSNLNYTHLCRNCDLQYGNVTQASIAGFQEPLSMLWDSWVNEINMLQRAHKMDLHIHNRNWHSVDHHSASSQDWLDLWLTHQRLVHLLPCPSCKTFAHSIFVLTQPPLIMYQTFDEPSQTQRHTIRRDLIVPTTLGDLCYKLQGVIYTAKDHFTASIMDFNTPSAWDYDGLAHDGRLRTRHLPLSTCDLQYLCDQNDAPAHVLVYARTQISDREMDTS